MNRAALTRFAMYIVRSPLLLVGEGGVRNRCSVNIELIHIIYHLRPCMTLGCMDISKNITVPFGETVLIQIIKDFQIEK